MKQPVARLIQNFVPKHYELAIEQNADTLTFSGTVTITGIAKNPERIILHSDELMISDATVNATTATIEYNPSEQTVTLSSANSKKDTTLHIAFSGTITKPMHGLYPCFFEHDGREKRLLATQFESHHAREVFPCIDEPEAKATFTLTLTTGAKDMVVSNTPIVSEEINTTTKTTVFDKTPVMSTYLLAWVSGELIYEEAVTQHGVTVRAYATPVHVGKTAFGLNVACKALDYMDDYFAIPYPLEKCDILALPDFAAGAMENWGCITFRESAMLIDEAQSDLSDKQHVAEVVTHELAHQWFGNLVTMRWWEDLWLNEGFASWVPYMVLDALYPEWNMWEQFATGDLMIGMRADALVNTHPIVVEIHKPSEIRSAFDSISYDKGCSVINLLYRYIGADAFQAGLQDYLREHAYSNAETKDLWRAWAKSSGKDVEAFMSAWTTKKGFPIVSVMGDETKALVSQERFLLNKDAVKDDTVWPVPLMRSSEDDTILDSRSMELQTPTKLNLGQSGFYRTIYSGQIASKLTKDIAAGTLHAVDVLGIINDASEAAKAGYHSTTMPMELIRSVDRSTSEALLSTALSELASYRAVLHDTYEPMKPFVSRLVRTNLERLGVDKKKKDSIDDELLRPSILAAASYSGDQQITEALLAMFESAKTPEDIRADIRTVVYHAAVREQANEKTYDKLLTWYKNNTIPGEQVGLVNALTSFEDSTLIHRTLGHITEDFVKLQDSLYWIAYSLIGRHSKHLAWQWLKDNWTWVGENFGKEKEIDYYLRYAANGFASQEHLDDYTAFFEKADIFGSDRAFEQGKETIAWQTAWKQRDEDNVIEWLKKQ